MLAPSHVVCGLGAVVVLGHSTGILPTPPELLIFIIGSLAPDIDGDGTITRPGHMFHPFIGRTLGKLVDGIVGLVGAIAKGIAGHRGLFHWPIVPILMFLAASHFELPKLQWFAFGYLVHILCDTLTVHGIPLLAPITQRNFSLRIMRTGSTVELFITALVFITTIVFGFSLLPDSVQNGMRGLVEHYKTLNHH